MLFEFPFVILSIVPTTYKKKKNQQLEKKEQTKSKVSRWKEIIKIRAEINKTESK